jgi:FKBP-type peptidyl-prolyl cis-trans isomerase
MQIKPYLSLALVSSITLVGCDKCSEKKNQGSQPQATTGATESTSTATITSTSPGDNPVDVGSAPADPGTASLSTGASTSAPTGAPTSSSTDAATSTGTASTAAPAPKGELVITDVKVGKGPEAVDGKKVTVHYTGTLENGTKFDSSKDRGTPFPFILGSGMVIAGWEKGVLGMKEGGVRKLVIPSHLAYGERSVGGVIPPNSTLVFEIELLKVE